MFHHICNLCWQSIHTCIHVQTRGNILSYWSFISVNHTYVHTHVHICGIHTYIYTYIHTTGWRRLIGSPKLQIIFHKRAIKYRSLLRKMTYKDKGSYESLPPCNTEICRHIMIYMIDFDEGYLHSSDT